MPDIIGEKLPVDMRVFVQRLRQEEKQREALKGIETEGRFAEIVVEELVDTFSKELSEAFEQHMYGTRTQENIDQAYAFLATCFSLLPKTSNREESKKTTGEVISVEKRIAKSMLMALYYLFVGNGINRLYAEYIEKNPGAKLQDRTIIEAELAEMFLQRWNEKNRESAQAKNVEYIPTSGFEFEYSDDLKAIGEILDGLKRIRNVCADAENMGWEQAKRHVWGRTRDVLDQTQKTFSSPKDAVAFYEGVLEPFYKLLDLYFLRIGITTEEPDIERLLTQKYASEKTWSNKDYHTTLSILFRIVPTSGMNLARLHCLVETDESISHVREVRTKPALSLTLQLREALYLSRSNLLKGKLGIHQTFAEVLLDQRHTNYTETVPLLTAAGYLGDQQPQTEMEAMFVTTVDGQPKYTKEEIREHIFLILQGKDGEANPSISKIVRYFLQHNGDEYVKKPYPTIDEYGSKKYLFFPNFTVKYKPSSITEFENIDEYPPDHVPERLIEVRGHSEVDFANPREFAMFVRSSTFFWFAAIGEHAAQEVENGSTDEVIQHLARPWKRLLSDWNEVLRTLNIPNPKPEERYLEYKDKTDMSMSKESAKNLPYSQHINAMLLWRKLEEKQEKRRNITEEQEQRRSLQSEARRIIREYQKEVREILKM